MKKSDSKRPFNNPAFCRQKLNDLIRQRQTIESISPPRRSPPRTYSLGSTINPFSLTKSFNNTLQGALESFERLNSNKPNRKDSTQLQKEEASPGTRDASRKKLIQSLERTYTIQTF